MTMSECEHSYGRNKFCVFCQVPENPNADESEISALKARFERLEKIESIAAAQNNRLLQLESERDAARKERDKALMNLQLVSPDQMELKRLRDKVFYYQEVPPYKRIDDLCQQLSETKAKLEDQRKYYEDAGIEQKREYEAKLAEAIRSKDSAYSERDKLVQTLSKFYPSHLARHPDSDTTWENDWRWIVCIHAPCGQLSWHIHDSERPMFAHLQVKSNDWDGHSTEEKYQRLSRLSNRNDRLAAQEKVIERAFVLIHRALQPNHSIDDWGKDAEAFLDDIGGI